VTDTPRSRVTSGSPYEAIIGFSRAVRVGRRVLVSGTGPVTPDGSCPSDAGAQAELVLDIVIGALATAGASAGDVVRTRMYLVDAGDWEAVAAAHARRFGEEPPAATMVVVAGFLDPRWRVEIEAEAEIGG
jgi:enamine deaminase RidA (YjgF/YER057c/UK114 family)